MKVKIRKKEGIQYLEVADDEINKNNQYGSPIVLALITNYFHSKCWSYNDYRLKENLIPSKYLGDSSIEIYDFNDYPKEDKDLILSKLHTYTLNEEGLFYWRYDGVDLNGDITEYDTRRYDSLGNRYAKEACFSYREAVNRLEQAKDFWENYNGVLMNKEIKIDNPHRQPHNFEYYFELSINKDKLKNKNKI